MRDIAVKLLEEVEANKLPSLPHILVKLLEACREEDVCFDTLSDIIGQDASLCTKVIKAANSPVYGRARNLNSLKHTLMFLGLDTIKSIAITASIKQFFSEYSKQKTGFLKSFWHHSLSCATIARSLAELSSYPYVEEAYIAGLLHDIGKLMLEPRMDAEYKSFDHGSYPADAILQSEQQTFGLNHTELAAILLKKWNLPDVVCDAVRYHHAGIDEIQQAHHLSRIVNLANLLSSNLNSEQQPFKTQAAIRLFDLSESIVDQLLTEAREKCRAIARSMDIDIGEDETDYNKDEIKQIQLAQEVRDNALVMSTQDNIKTESNDLYKSIQQSISLIFDIDNSLILNLDTQTNQLKIASPQYFPESKLLEALTVDLTVDSIITQCLKEHKITSSFTNLPDSSHGIFDQQIIRAMNTEGLICIPAFDTTDFKTILLLACTETKAEKIIENESLLKLFSDNIAEKISSHYNYTQKILDIANENSQEFLQRARSIIHETNNPLSVIRNYLQLLSKKLDSNDPAQNDLQTIKQEIDRISNIIIRCKDKYESGTYKPLDVDINKLILELSSLYKSSLFTTHNIKLNLKLDNNLNRIKSDKDTIKQIITNLIKNSVEAIENNGEITITSGNININGMNHIELKLQDSGPGIPAEIMKNLYRPVTSTKGNGHSGLGLSITKNLVDRLGGLISCKTDGNGTEFSVQFPEEIQAGLM